VSGFASAVEAFLTHNEWPYERLADDDPDIAIGDTPVFLTSVRSDDETWPVIIAVAGDGPTHLVVQSILPAVAQPGGEVPVMEVLTRLNDGLVNGCFELNFDDGTIRLRSSMPVRSLAALDATVMEAVVEELVIANVETADWAVPAIRAVLDGALAPALAVAAVENGIDPAGG
jgi:hypothetical protein